MNRRAFLRNSAALSISSYAAPSFARAFPTTPTHSPFRGLTAAQSIELEKRNLIADMAKINALLARGPFQPNWNSLSKHKDADWFRDAKFGIYTHWGPVTVGSSFSPGDAEWYGNQMYTPKHPAFAYHQKTFGDQHRVGYKDIIPKLTGEHFDPDHWADIAFRAGAKFAGPVAIHHDNFAMWNSSLTRWNSVLMGPHRDVVGELAKAYRGKGLKFFASFHHGFAWRYYEPSFGYDGSNPETSDLYTEAHRSGAPPSEHFMQRWLAEVYEVLTRYQPELIYFDFEFYEVITPEYQKRLFATAYDWAAENSRTISVTQKDRKIHDHTGIIDFERGREDAITPYPWLTDTATGPWFYVAVEKLKTPHYFVSVLCDIVAKNGCLLLDVGPKIDGSFPEESEKILLTVGEWLRTNGEAIYGTRPYRVYGEGPTNNKGGSGFTEDKDKPYTGEDVRYTTKRDALYAIFLGKPSPRIVLKSVNGASIPGGIREVHAVGAGTRLNWTLEDGGLRIDFPENLIAQTNLCCAVRIT